MQWVKINKANHYQARDRFFESLTRHHYNHPVPVIELENGKVILAVSPQSGYNGQGIGELLPLPLFAKHASALAHVDFELDNDGRCRQVYLAGGLGNAHWPAFGLALGGNLANLSAESIKNENVNLTESAQGWLRKKKYRIPFVGPPNSFQTLSYVDVLNHQIATILGVNRPGTTKLHGSSSKDFSLVDSNGFLLLWGMKGLDS